MELVYQAVVVVNGVIMSKVLTTLWIVVATLTPLAGQPAPVTYRACMDKAANPLAMAACEDREVRRLQGVATQKSRQLSDVIRQNRASGKDEKALAAVEAEQKAWDRYAQAYLDALYPVPESDRVGEFGTRYLYESVAARGFLLRLRISALDRLIRQYSE